MGSGQRLSRRLKTIILDLRFRSALCSRRRRFGKGSAQTDLYGGDMRKTGIGFLLIFFWAAELFAETPYFQGKTIRIIVGYPAGSAHDLWARLIAPQLTKQIPGNPATVVQIMTGAGSMTAANYIYGVAKPDGLILGVVNAGLYLEQLQKKQEAHFDWPKFTWVGSATRTTPLLYMWANTPYKTIHDVRTATVPPKG